MRPRRTFKEWVLRKGRWILLQFSNSIWLQELWLLALSRKLNQISISRSSSNARSAVASSQRGHITALYAKGELREWFVWTTTKMSLTKMIFANFRCIKKMDHHCPWVNNCVGEQVKIGLLKFKVRLLWIGVYVFSPPKVKEDYWTNLKLKRRENVDISQT